MRYMLTTLDVSKLSGWLNTDPPYACSAWWRRRNRHARGWTDSRLGARAGAERTQNMLRMVVTLDVSKLSGWLNAFASCRTERRACGGRGEAQEA